MANCDNPEILEAYNDVINDKSETTWVVLGYESNTSNVVVVKAKGEGNPFEAIKEHLPEDECCYAYIRVNTGDEESTRSKFALIAWVGSKVKPLRRAKMSVHRADVKNVIRNFAVEFHAETLDEIDEPRMMAAVIKAGGADYSGTTAK